MPEKPFWEKETFYVIILIGTGLLLYFFRLEAMPIGDSDEGKHASTSKDMVISGDWITPKYNGENFYDKPPLYNWLAAISFKLFGFTALAARLPAAFLGLGCVMITYWLARTMFGSVVAFLSALVLATSAEHIVLSRAVVHDISLAFFVSLTLTLFFVGYKNERHRKPAFLFGYAAAGFAVLAKGPIGLALPVMIVGLFLIYKKQLKLLREMQIGWGLLIFLAIAAPWYILISVRNPDYLGYFLLEKNFGSFLSQHSRHQEPFYYYFPVLAGGLFPWSLFFPLALYRAFRAKAALHGDGIIFALIWFSVIFIFFSTANSKLGTYILPLFPAASVLVGVLWYDLLYASNRILHKWVFLSYLPFAAVILLALVYLLLFAPDSLVADTGISLHLLIFFCCLDGRVCIVINRVDNKKKVQGIHRFNRRYVGNLISFNIDLYRTIAWPPYCR